MWEIFLDLAIINKALEVSFPFTSYLMINSNASKRLPFPMSTFVPSFALSFYLYTADRCDGYCSSPHQYIPSTVHKRPAHLHNSPPLLHTNMKCRAAQQSRQS